VRAATVETSRVILLAVTLAVTSALASAHMPVSTNVAQAQAAIDRGLFLYYAYNGDDAARAFEQAAVLDPHLAMAYWGIALADGPDLNTPVTDERFASAAKAIAEADAMKVGASSSERNLIDAMSLRYKGSFSQWGADDAAYRQAMSRLAQSSNDENVALLTAEALLESGGLQWHGGSLASPESQQAFALVTGVLRDDPASVMANHLCIHLYDLAPSRSPAHPCAERLDATNFVPEAEHLAHMPAHYWIETGEYAAALRSSRRACDLLDVLATGDSEHVQHYEKHDVAVGYSAAMMLGDYAVAERWSQRMSAAFGTNFDALTALRFGRYEQAYAADGTSFAETSVRGIAAIHLGRIAEAEDIAKRTPASATRGYLPEFFFARLAEAQRNYVEAERWIERARQNQLAAFSGELIPLIPADEALGALRLRRGDAAGAAAAFTDALIAYPNDPRALFGLAEAQSADGDTAQAAVTRTHAEKEWGSADTNVADALP
jgi:hypothetical protein